MEPNLSKTEFLVEDGHANGLSAERASATDTLCRYLEEQAKAQAVLAFRGWPTNAAMREKMISLELTRAKMNLACAVDMGIDSKTAGIEAWIRNCNADDNKDGVIENIEDFFFIYRKAIFERAEA